MKLNILKDTGLGRNLLIQKNNRTKFHYLKTHFFKAISLSTNNIQHNIITSFK